MNQQWLVKHVLSRMGEAYERSALLQCRYLTADEARNIVDQTIDDVGRYGTDTEYKYLAGHRKRLAHSLSRIPIAETDTASCLDVGCFGYMAMWASKYLGYRYVEGVEWYPGVNEPRTQRQLTLGSDSFTFTVHNFDIDSSTWPLDRTYDTVLFFEVLEHVNHDPVRVMLNIGRVMTRSSILVMSVPNAVSYKTLREFLVGMPPWTYWFFEPDLAHEPRHCFEYTPLVAKVLLCAAGFEERSFEVIYAYSDMDAERGIIDIAEALSIEPAVFGETMVMQAVKVADDALVRFPDILYSSDGYYRSTFPILQPLLDATVRKFHDGREALLKDAGRLREQNSELLERNQELAGVNAELLFTCDCYLRNDAMLHQAMRAAEVRASEAQRELDALRTSTTWIMTEPLRSVLGRFPGASRLAGRSLRWAWWALTLQLPRKLEERRRARGSASEQSPDLP
jgi:SAM-dependent methyltransferase